MRQGEASNRRQLLDTAATVRPSGATGGGPIIIGLLCDPVRGSTGKDGSNLPPASDQPESYDGRGTMEAGDFDCQATARSEAEFARGSCGNSAKEPLPPPWPRMVRPAR